MMPTKLTAALAAIVGVALAVPAHVHADAAKCHKTYVKQLVKFKKTYLKALEKCLDADNVGKIAGPCPDLNAQLKIQKVTQKVPLKLATACTMADLTALGFGGTCQFEAATQGIEGACAAKPLTTPTEFADCLLCWKGAELAEFVAILYASHATEVCGALDETSAVCSEIKFATPLPDQRDLGDNSEGDCQKAVGKAGVKYLLAREKILEKCALAGGTEASCLADLKLQIDLQKAEAKKDAAIQKVCGNLNPAPSPPFCCKTGVGNSCTIVADRAACELIPGSQQQDGKTCDMGTLKCQPAAGNNQVTWWGVCPETGAALTTLKNLITCVDDSADAIVEELLCLQFRGNGGADWPCPSDG